MPSTLTLSVVSESQEGTIGDDWKFDLEIKVYSGALTGKETVSVAKHNLGSGKTQAPPGPPSPVKIPSGDPGADIKVDLKLIATEVDLLRNDVGEHRITLDLKNPSDGQTTTLEQEISAGVTEQPSGSGNAVFKLGLKLVLAS